MKTLISLCCLLLTLVIVDARQKVKKKELVMSENDVLENEGCWACSSDFQLVKVVCRPGVRSLPKDHSCYPKHYPRLRNPTQNSVMGDSSNAIENRKCWACASNFQLVRVACRPGVKSLPKDYSCCPKRYPWLCNSTQNSVISKSDVLNNRECWACSSDFQLVKVACRPGVKSLPKDYSCYPKRYPWLCNPTQSEGPGPFLSDNTANDI